MIEGLGERLKIERERRGYSQEFVAKNLHSDNSTITRYEKGDITPSPEMLIKLAAFYKVSVDYILGLSKELTMSLQGLDDEQIKALALTAEIFKRDNDLKKEKPIRI